MNLWIRNQNKTFIGIVNNVYCNEINDNMFELCTQLDAYHKDILGIYESKERCLEILNEIHKLLTPMINVPEMPKFESLEDIPNMCNFIVQKQDIEVVKQLDTVVYQMPKE